MTNTSEKKIRNVTKAQKEMDKVFDEEFKDTECMDREAEWDTRGSICCNGERIKSYIAKRDLAIASASRIETMRSVAETVEDMEKSRPMNERDGGYNESLTDLRTELLSNLGL